MPRLSESELEFYLEICQKLASDQPFSLSRWGDGEWYAVESRPGHNCDKNDYNIKDELNNTLSNRLNDILATPKHLKYPPYYMCAQQVESCYSAHHLFTDQEWQSANIFHWASKDGQLSHLFNALKTATCVIYIGNASLSRLPFISQFIEIPDKNVFNQYNKILLDISNTFTDNACQILSHKTYIFSAGMAANVFIDDLYNANPYNTYIDIGSVFDPYVGRNSRGYHHKLSIDKTLMNP